MKIRTNYVSNSSSSSFLIAYDESFFGDLARFFKEGPFYECSFRSGSDAAEEFLQWLSECDEEYMSLCKSRIEDAADKGKTLLYMRLDYDYKYAFNLLEQINSANGGDKMDVIYGDNE